MKTSDNTVLFKLFNIMSRATEEYLRFGLMNAMYNFDKIRGNEEFVFSANTCIQQMKICTEAAFMHLVGMRSSNFVINFQTSNNAMT